MPIACVAATLAPARADEVYGTRSEALYERDHAIELRMGRGHARLVVRRTFDNQGPKHDQAVVHVHDMPPGAVATGLRAMAIQNGAPVWFAGDLLEAELAAARYKALTGIGGYYPKDPALLSWRGESHLALQVFPIDPKGKKTVEYTLEAPTRWVDGRWTLELPKMGTEKLAATAKVHAEDAGDALEIDDVEVAPGAIRSLAGGLSIALRPKAPKTLGGSLASVGFAKGRALVHTSIEIAGRVSQAPKGAWVVVVVDGSRSLTDEERSAQVAATKAYLGHLPDAHVQVLAFDREVKPLHAAFVGTGQAVKDLEGHAWAKRNGSALDLALGEAAKRIAQAPDGAPRRILLTTDLRTASTLTPATVPSLASTKAVVHLATIGAGAPRLVRDDVDPWSAVPRATGGVLWRAFAKPKDEARARVVFEEWARPLRVDRIALGGVGLAKDLEAPTSLAEGEGFDDLRLTDFPTPSIEVRGELWSSPIKTVLATTADEERRWAALVFGSELHHDLKESEMMALAIRGGAVSPVTSYLAIEPGVRPSTEGLEEGEAFGVGGLGLFGVGAGGGGCGIGLGTTFDHRRYLRDALAPAVAACGGAGKALKLRLETTRTEVVAATASTKGPGDDTLKACVVEAAWALDLPAAFSQSFARWEVPLDG